MRDQNSGPGDGRDGDQSGAYPFAELNEAWSKADKDEARAVADRWTKSAEKIEGVTRETLETSAAMYLAEKALLKKHGAIGITINCLGGFYGGHIHAYPVPGLLPTEQRRADRRLRVRHPLGRHDGDRDHAHARAARATSLIR